MARRRRTRQLAAVACLPLVVSGLYAGGSPATAAATTATSTVSWQAERQHIDGFGGSFAFHKAGSIQRLGEPLTSEILDMIFDQETGIGLDIVRVMVGDGGVGTWGDTIYDGPTETIMPEPGRFVWDDPDWEQHKDEFDAYQIWLMRQAQARGIETILASVWSPPAWMKENNSVIGGGELPNRLRDDMYQEFADYLAEYVLGYQEHFGITITHVSPTNEPDFSAGYSSSVWTPQELNTFVRDHLGPTFAVREVPAQIVLGEAIDFSDAYVRPALTDSATADYVDVVAAHAYTGLLQEATAPNVDEWTLSTGLGKTIWQTEYMNQGEPRDRLFVNNTITDGLRYATLIANLFDQVQLNGYFWWWPASNSGADGSNLIRLQNDGSPQSGNPTETGQYRVFKRYYAIGNYSRFIAPGWVMVDADKHPADGVIVTAYKDPASGNFALVAINQNPADTEVSFTLDGFPAGLGAVVPYRTSPSENLRTLDPVPVESGAFTHQLRGASVTTFVPEQFALPPLPDRKDVFSTYLAAENDGTSDGLQVRHTSDGRAVLTGVRDGGYVRYDNVNFADGSAAGFLEQMGELRMHAHVTTTGGGAIEVRLGDPVTGPVVGVMEVPAAGQSQPVTVSTDIDTSEDGGAYGFHDLYLVFARGCTQTITGSHAGPLTVTSGVTCLADATVAGPVTVAAGASLVSYDSQISGPVAGQGAAEVTLCGTRVAGPVQLHGSGVVSLGDPTAGCAPNVVSGPVQVTGATGPGVIAGNRIAGPVACSGNQPAPVDNGHTNQVAGPVSGQCADLSGEVQRLPMFELDYTEFSD